MSDHSAFAQGVAITNRDHTAFAQGVAIIKQLAALRPRRVEQSASPTALGSRSGEGIGVSRSALTQPGSNRHRH
jgi:hypothetical protein